MIRQALSRGFAAVPNGGALLRVVSAALVLAGAAAWLRPPEGSPAMAHLAALALVPFQFLCSLGMMSVALGVIRQTPDAERLVWRAVTKLPQFVGLGILATVALLLAAVPVGFGVLLAGKIGVAVACAAMAGAVYVAIVYSQAAFVILDDRSEWFDALGESAALSRGRRLNLIAFLLVGIVPLAIVGSAVPLAGRFHLVGTALQQPVVVVAAIASTALSAMWTLITAAYYDGLLRRDHAQSPVEEQTLARPAGGV